ncbi:class I SAM-dependent methyltransferase [Chloroflexota bacterium]
MFDIDEYLRDQGLKNILPPERFWVWARKRIGSKNIKAFVNIMEQRANHLPENSIDIYDFLASPEISLVGGSFEYLLLKEILQWVAPKLPSKGVVVEIGCHTGLHTRYYAKCFPEAYIVGIDISKKAIEEAKKLADEHNIKNVSFYTGDILKNESLPELETDCIVSGRLLGELMTPVRRRRESWDGFEYPPIKQNLDQNAKLAITTCKKWLRPNGKFLIIERLSDFDRLNRLANVLIDTGYQPDHETITPISWTDVAGDHQTWFFEAIIKVPNIAIEENTFLPPNVPIPSRETEAVGNFTRIMFDGILAWQTWKSLSVVRLEDEATLCWSSGEKIHYEIGISISGLGFACIASNTDIFLLTLFLPQEMKDVHKDLKEYVSQLRSTGARSA